MLTTLRNRFFETPIFKGLVKDYAEKNESIILPTKKLEQTIKETESKVRLVEQQKTQEILQIEKERIPEIVQEELKKAEMLEKKDAMRFRIPFNYNGNQNPDRKPGSDVPFSYLRRMATLYPVARAAINYRIRQITQLDWGITTVDEIEGEKGFESQIRAIQSFFKQPMGPHSRLREMLTTMVDDVLTVDAVTFEKQRTRGGKFLNLVPVDPTTIVLLITETGGTPLPPETAYRQVIRGATVAEFTTEEMIYEAMNNRSYGPYGQSPLESLILQCESALRGTLYNLNYLRENNVPEGFITLPEDQAMTKDQVEQWQTWFDSMVAGDPRFTHRLKFLPNGSTYQPSTKPEDMSFEKFEMWLLQQTCAMFEVQPQDLGITLHINKATSQSQQEIGVTRGLIPLANFIKEIFDDLIQEELGFPALQWQWTNINPVDRKEESDIAKNQIDMGAKSVDEYRIEQGLPPIGLEHYIMTSQGPILVKDFVAGKKTIVDPVQENNATDAEATETEDSSEIAEQQDLKRWRTCVYTDLKEGKEPRTAFKSKFIDPEIHEDIAKELATVKSRAHAKILFDRYIDKEMRASMTLLKMAEKMRRIENADIKSE